MSDVLSGKLAIVTGASRGIGAAIAHNLASKGISKLLLTYTSPSSVSSIESVRTSLLSFHPHLTVHTLAADMGTVDGPSTVVIAALKLAPQIDIIINNAGVSVNNVLKDCTAEDFANQYNINVRGPLLLVKAAEKYLPTDNSGRIVNLSSVSATLGFPAQSIYGGTKAALDAMTRTWARELAGRCTVNSVNPGPVDTDMYSGTTAEFQQILKPFIVNAPGMQVMDPPGSRRSEQVEKEGGRRGKPEEVAGVVGMICTPEAGWCTGSVVCANGGMVMGLN